MPISANGSVHSVTYILEGFSLTTGYYNPNIFGELMIHASSCGAKKSALPSHEVLMAAVTTSSDSVDRIQKILPLLFSDVFKQTTKLFFEIFVCLYFPKF